MNVYSELLELLTPERKDAPAGLFADGGFAADRYRPGDGADRGAVLSPRDGVPQGGHR